MLSSSLSIRIPQFKFDFPLEAKLDVAERAIKHINYRLFNESISGNDQLLEENSAFWSDVKEREGLYPQPFAATGAMTRRDAWEIIPTNNGITIRLQEEHQKKWVNITDTGKINWSYAYVLSDGDMKVVSEAINNYMTKHLNKILVVDYVG